MVSQKFEQISNDIPLKKLAKWEIPHISLPYSILFPLITLKKC
jgi:hypothetical protein